MYEEPTRPDTPDYYADLGVAKDAEKAEIRKAFKLLALLHHPDKRAPGTCEDAIEFRRAREAYEILIDEDERATYDDNYGRVQAEWTQYYHDLTKWQKNIEAKRLRKKAEELARQKAVEEEERRKAAREAEHRRNEEVKRARQATEDYGTRRNKFANWASGEAERRKQEAKRQEEDARWEHEYEDMEKRKQDAKDREEMAEEARKNVEEWARKKREAREEEQRQRRRAQHDQRRRARGYPKQDHGSLCSCFLCRETYWTRPQPRFFYTQEEREQLEEEAQQRTEEAAERARKEQVRQAEERLEKQRAAEQKKQERDQAAQERKKAAKSKTAELRTQEAARRHREEQQKQAQLRMAKAYIEKQQQLYLAANTNAVGEATVVIDLRWLKKKGKAQCLFCEEKTMYYSFHCPEGGAVACNSCKNNMSRYTLPTPEPEDEDGVLEDLTNVTLEDGGEQK